MFFQNPERPKPMASSKDLDGPVSVPENVLALWRHRSPIVFLNLRPDQRNGAQPARDRELRRHWNHTDGELVYDGFERFLETVNEPTKVVILYQGHKADLFTVVVELRSPVYWSPSGAPRLDFAEPSNWNHGALWGGFVLAIARVGDIEPTVVIGDPTCEHFCGIVQEAGLPSLIPRFRSTIILPIDLTQFQSFDRGTEIRQHVPLDWGLRAGDRLEYEAGHSISGMAQITGVNGDVASIKKIS
jgi:hypothetical protein